jgi:hypothetical protein
MSLDPRQTDRPPVDFNLHGIVGIRLLDASPADVSAVRRQLGPIEGIWAGEPDIAIRFVDRLVTPDLRYLGLQDAAFTDDAFYILRGKQKSPVMAQIPLDQVGGRIEIVCERGLAAVPLLIALINATAIARGAVPLHAAAMTYEGTGILATGWTKGGKTEMLLAFVANGAHYVGDEWVYLDRAGRTMAGIPEPIRVWDWHLSELPEFRARLNAGQRRRLALLRPLLNGLRRAGDSAWLPRRAAGLARRAEPLLRRQHGVDVAPERLFGPNRFASVAPLDRVFLVVSHAADEVTVRPIAGREVARRMVFSLLEEIEPLRAAYNRFRFAFPDVRNEFLDCLPDAWERALAEALADKEAYVVYHPYPVPVRRLFAAARPYATGSASQ